MRRTSYTDRLDKAYVRVQQKPKMSMDGSNNSFRLDLHKLSQDRLMRANMNQSHHQSPTVRGSLSIRPLTNHKLGSQTALRSTGRSYAGQTNDNNAGKPAKQKDLMVDLIKQSKSNRESTDQIKGRIFRGTSWKGGDKFQKQFQSSSITSRYQRKSETPIELRDSMAKGKKPSSALLDLIGSNLKINDQKEDEFFEYVMRFSYRTKKGYIPNNSLKQNQDAFIISPNINHKTWQHLFAVCDGHGPLGHYVSGFIKNTLPDHFINSKTLLKTPKESIHKVFELAYEKMLKQLKIDMNFSGSTVISVYFQQNKLYCANVGDSRAILGRFNEKSWEAVPLSNDHKPNIQKEAERIRKMRGRIQAYKDERGQSIGPLRVWLQNQNAPGLAMTRSFGDLVGASIGVSPIPQIKQFTLTHNDKIVVIGSDGVFQFLSNEQIMRSLIPYYENKQIQQASDNLLSMATRSWSKNSSIIDDITFILIFLNYNEVM